MFTWQKTILSSAILAAPLRYLWRSYSPAAAARALRAVPAAPALPVRAAQAAARRVHPVQVLQARAPLVQAPVAHHLVQAALVEGI